MSLPFAYTRDARMSPRPAQFPARQRKPEHLVHTPSLTLRRARKQFDLQKYAVETRRDLLPSSTVLDELNETYSPNAYIMPCFLDETVQNANSNLLARKTHQTASIHLRKNPPSFIQVEVGYEETRPRSWRVNSKDSRDVHYDTTEDEETLFCLEL